MFSVVQSLQDHGVCPEIIPEIKGDISLAEVLYENGVQVNPGEELAPKQVRVPPTVSWNAKEGTYYTLMFIDPDAPSRTNPKKHCCKHWMVVNIPGKEVSRGVVDTEYVGCGPPEGSGLHRYIFLVYAQPGPLEKYKSNHKPISGYSIGGRIPFSAADFSRENGLGQPVAANFFQAQYDESVKEITKKMMKFPYVFGNVGNILSMKISDVFK